MIYPFLYTSATVHTPKPAHTCRDMEYQQFEKKLEACLSSTAVKTKFAAHTARGRDLVVREGAIMEQVVHGHC